MGWTAYPLPNKRWKLWSRGGTRGVCIKGGDSGNEEIEIPSKLLKSLVADDVRSHFKSRKCGRYIGPAIK